MSCTPAFSLIEPLEARIAPATLFLGGSNDSYKNHTGNPGVSIAMYSTDPSQLGSGYDPSDPFGANFVGGTNTYYAKLVAGDVVKIASSEGYKDQLIQVQSGTAIVFFTDLGNPDNAYETGELTGISLGKNASVIIKGSVNGDIVGNYNDATGKIVQNPNTPDLQKWWVGQSVNSLTVDNANSVIFGGSIKSLTGKVVNRILAGNAADGLSYDFNASDSDGGGTLGIGLLNKQAGSSISNVTVVGTDVIRAGDGGAGAAGGSITGVTLSSDSDGFTLKAGNGGNGNSTVPGAGIGGSISKVYAQGNSDSSANSPGISAQTFQADDALPSIQILAGKGGAGGLPLVGNLSNGAGGGSVTNVYVGYEVVSGKTTASTFVVQDSVLVLSGAGGDGLVGGNGGSLSNVKVLTITPNDVNPTHPANEIEIGSGDGGANTAHVAGAKSGAGGAISNLEVRDVNASEIDAQIDVHAGNGGSTMGSGGSGGSISNATLIAYHIAVKAGDGTSGSDFLMGLSGGTGGSLSSITVPVSPEGIIPTSVDLSAGDGGDAKVGNGAAGGNISKITISQVDATDISLLAGNAGSGFNTKNGKGGAGGSISTVTVTDGDFYHSAITGSFTMTSGTGGNGAATGGSGGSISVVQFTGDDLSYSVQTGSGGDGGNGNGGNGGAISNAAFVTLDSDGAQNYTGSIVSGHGGVGIGAGSGGNGGNMTQVTGSADSDVQIVGGHGGLGVAKAAGVGSSLKNVGIVSKLGSALLQSGEAGTDGSTGGNGGSITGANILAHLDISIFAGDGHKGGAGGNITSVGYSDSTPGLEPLGTVTVHAGNGSQGSTSAGTGGSITTLSGFIGDHGITKIFAGDGGGSLDHLKAGAGGSIQHVALYGGGNAVGTELQIQAGDAGNAISAKTGAKGGDVKDLAVTKLSAQAIFRYIAAGDGGAALTGGLGGTIDQITVQGSAKSPAYTGDIGVRSGVEFGYLSMGGLFAGQGGGGTVKTGTSGNVTNIRADAIAAIVAGKMQVGDTIQASNLVNKVDQIYLNGATAPALDAGNKSFNNWDTANMVGAIIHPTDANANTFDASKWGDSSAPGNIGTFGIGDTITDKTDGFVAAVNYPVGKLNHTNFVPEALLTVNDPTQVATASNSKFVDNNNQY